MFTDAVDSEVMRFSRMAADRDFGLLRPGTDSEIVTSAAGFADFTMSELDQAVTELSEHSGIPAPALWDAVRSEATGNSTAELAACLGDLAAGLALELTGSPDGWMLTDGPAGDVPAGMAPGETYRQWTGSGYVTLTAGGGFDGAMQRAQDIMQGEADAEVMRLAAAHPGIGWSSDVLELAGRKLPAHVHAELDDSAVDHSGGDTQAVIARYRALAKSMFGVEKPHGASQVIKPKSAAQRARERAASRPGHTGMGGAGSNAHPTGTLIGGY